MNINKKFHPPTLSRKHPASTCHWSGRPLERLHRLQNSGCHNNLTVGPAVNDLGSDRTRIRPSQDSDPDSTRTGTQTSVPAVVVLSPNQLGLWVNEILKSVNIWQSYKSVAVSCTLHAWPTHCWKTEKVHERITFLLVTFPNIHRFKKSHWQTQQ